MININIQGTKVHTSDENNNIYDFEIDSDMNIILKTDTYHLTKY